jgi:hypothetical protein
MSTKSYRATMTNLKKAREQGKLEEFIKEHEKDAPGDQERLDDVHLFHGYLHLLKIV